MNDMTKTDTLVGTSPVRPDGVPKAAGSHTYADDFQIEGMYWGATLRSPHPHSRIRSSQGQQNRAPESAVCVTAKDLTGPNSVLYLTTFIRSRKNVFVDLRKRLDSRSCRLNARISLVPDRFSFITADRLPSCSCIL